MQWNNILVLIWIVYMFTLPLYLCFDSVITSSSIGTLLMFDILFMLDRITDLFLGSYTVDGQLETKLLSVVKKNF